MTEPTYNDELRHLDVEIDRFARIVNQRAGVPGVWPWYATVHEGRLRCWRHHQRTGTHTFANERRAGSTCSCGLVTSTNPTTDEGWQAFFASPGHLDSATDMPARSFIALGGPYRAELWCAHCGPVASLATDPLGRPDARHRDHEQARHDLTCPAASDSETSRCRPE
jgi:hypothetical protein